MLSIQDSAIVLSLRPYGERDAIVSALTATQGRWAGLARGGAGRRQAALWQPGNRIAAEWRARLPTHLGTWTAELETAYAAAAMGEPGRLAALASACALLDTALPERDPQPTVFARLDALLRALGVDENWAKAYALWERDLLADLGFGLDLSACAATGETGDLIYVSPKTARAVSAAAGAIYKARLLPLPAFFRDASAPAPAEAIADALKTTGFFLEREAFAPLDRPIPAARTRLVERVRA